MKKNLLISMLIAASAFLLCSCTIAFTNTGTQAENKTEPVIAEGLPGFEAEGSTDLPGKFFLSFVYSRNLIMLDGRGNIVWSKHEEQPTEGALTGLWDLRNMTSTERPFTAITTTPAHMTTTDCKALPRGSA